MADQQVRRWTGRLAAASCAVVSLLPLLAGHASAGAAPAPRLAPAGCDHPAGDNTVQCYSVIYQSNSFGPAGQPPATALGPADIQAAYGLGSGADGMTIGVVDADGYATAEADLATFRGHYGLPPCTTANGCFRKVDQNGGTSYPREDSGWALETALDLDAISAACPACHILLVESSSPGLTNMGAAENTAVRLGAQVVSNSYGVSGETPAEQSYDHYYDHPGVAIVAASGDIGNAVSWPASGPHVTAAGGTSLRRDSASSRGWSESAWSEGGSGCSAYEPRPAYQAKIADDCSGHKSTSDVAADADPATGLAVYTTDAGGWLQVGGTSLSAPLIAATYALAGTPAPGSYPVSYPYQAASTRLNDVTTGTNGTCGNVLCTAGPGWDGPTGLGTPAGPGAFTTGPHGTLTGIVTAAPRQAALAGGTVTAHNNSTGQDFSASTDSTGRYDLLVPAGSYDVTAARFGYDSRASELNVTDGASVTADYALWPRPKVLVTGLVRDGSGLGVPMYAKLTVAGDPDAPVFTNQQNGRYLLFLPVNGTYQITASAATTPGYVPTSLTVHVGWSPVHQDIALLVDQSTCTAPGYAYTYNAVREQFTGWSGTTTRDGWTNVDNNGSGQLWNFSNPGGLTPPPGGDTDFANVDSGLNWRVVQNTSLVSPVIDLGSVTGPEVGFDTDYGWFFAGAVLVDVSLDGGTTWTNVWTQMQSTRGHVDVPIPAAAGDHHVRVRFTYTGHQAGYWSVDNVFVGSRTCVPISGPGQ